MLVLSCVVVGDGSVVSMACEPSTLVSFVKKHIKEEMQFSFPASQLRLFVAKKDDGSWMLDDDEDFASLSQKDVSQDLCAKYLKDASEMRPTRRVAWYGIPENDKQADGEVQVLVQVPDPTAISSSESPIIAAIAELSRKQDEISRKQDDIGAELKALGKRKSVAFSSLRSDNWSALRGALNLSVRQLKATEPDLQDDHLKYEWLSCDEDDAVQVKAYMNYLHEHLGFLDEDEEPRLKLVDVHHNHTLLNVDNDRLPFSLKGTTDAVIMEEGFEVHTLDGLYMLIELKKESVLKPGDAGNRKSVQAIAQGQLLATGLLRPEISPVALLTNLTDVWSFSWFSEPGVIQELNLKHPTNAFDFIRRCVAKAEEGETDGFKPSYVESNVKRRKLLDVIPEDSSGSSRLEEIVEQYRSIAACLGPDFEMAQACAREMVRSIPIYSHMYS